MTNDDEVAGFLVRRSAGAGAGTACPEANLLVGYAEGTLAPDELERVAAHAAGCSDCRDALDELDAAASPQEAPENATLVAVPGGQRRTVRRWPVVAAAAALLTAVGAGVFVARERGEEPPADTGARLIVAANRLAKERPALFGDLVPFDPRMRPPTGDGRERGGLRLLAPSDVVLPGRPSFRWSALPGATRYEVSLESDDGRTLWTRGVTDTALAYPEGAVDLVPGTRYAWSVATEGVLGGRIEGRRPFQVATAKEATAFEEATHAVAAQVAPDLRDLLLAHVALRRGLVEEAERHARAHLARVPTDALGRATLRHVLLVQGSPEAAALEDREAGGR